MESKQGWSEGNEKKYMLNLGDRLRTTGQYQEALGIFSDLVEKYPFFIGGYLFKGHLLWQCLDRSEEGLQCFQKAAELSPDSELASLGVFHCLWSQGEHVAALLEADRFYAYGTRSKDYDEMLSSVWDRMPALREYIPRQGESF